MNNDQLLVEYYIREVLKSEKTNKLIVEQILLLESGYINEGLYDKIKSLGKYSKTTALILTMLISSGISSSYAKENPDKLANAMQNAGLNFTASEVETAVSDGNKILDIEASETTKNGKKLTQLAGLGSTITGSGGPESSGLQTVSERDVTEAEIIKEIDRDIKKLAADKKIKSIHYAYKVIIIKAKNNVNLSDDAIAKIEDIASFDVFPKYQLEGFNEKFKKFSKWVNSDEPNLISLDYLASAISLFKVCKIMKEDCIKTLKNINKGAVYKSKMKSKEASVSDITGKRYSKGNSKFKKLQQDDNPYFEFFMLTRKNLIKKLHNAVKSDNIESIEWSNLFKKIFNHCTDSEGIPSIRNLNVITGAFNILYNKHKIYEGIEEMGVFNLGDDFSITSVDGVGGADVNGRGRNLNSEIEPGVASRHLEKLKKGLKRK